MHLSTFSAGSNSSTVPNGRQRKVPEEICIGSANSQVLTAFFMEAQRAQLGATTYGAGGVDTLAKQIIVSSA